MLGLVVVVDLPSVGKNLQDHPTVAIAAHLRRRARQPRALRPAPNVNLRFSSGLNDCHRADCWLSIANKISWHPIGARFAALGVSVYKPYSKGRVTLRSTRIEDEPRVEFNLLSDHRDMQRIKLGMRLANELLMEPSVRSLITYAFPASFLGTSPQAQSVRRDQLGEGGRSGISFGRTIAIARSCLAQPSAVGTRSARAHAERFGFGGLDRRQRHGLFSSRWDMPDGNLV